VLYSVNSAGLWRPPTTFVYAPEVVRAAVVASFISVISLGILAPRTSRADEPSAADIASARKLGFEGITQADKGNCAGAVDKLARAEKLFHAPTTLGRLGECQVQLGKVVEGTENLGRAAREELAPNAPPVFVAARARARKALAAATPKLAHAKIVVKAPPGVTPSVAIDSVPLPAANVGEDRALDPGPHLVEATAPGYVTASAAINLREGGTEEVTLTLTIDPNAAKSLAPVTTSPTTPDTTKPNPATPAAEGSPNRTLAYVVLGVGVVGVGVGTVFGLTALSKKNDLAQACPNNACRTTQQDNLDSAKSAGTISTIAFGAGAAALIVGGVLFFTASPPATTGKTGKTASPAKLAARPYFDMTSAGVVGIW
jgi:hypothetical protein